MNRRSFFAAAGATVAAVCAGSHAADAPVFAHLFDQSRQGAAAAFPRGTADHEMPLALQYLGDDLTIRRLQFTDVIQEQLKDIQTDSDEDLFDAQFALMIGELRLFLPRLLDWFDGEPADYQEKQPGQPTSDRVEQPSPENDETESDLPWEDETMR